MAHVRMDAKSKGGRLAGTSDKLLEARTRQLLAALRYEQECTIRALAQQLPYGARNIALQRVCVAASPPLRRETWSTLRSRLRASRRSSEARVPCRYVTTAACRLG
jgi:hypothetical protein